MQRIAVMAAKMKQAHPEKIMLTYVSVEKKKKRTSFFTAVLVAPRERYFSQLLSMHLIGLVAHHNL